MLVEVIEAQEPSSLLKRFQPAVLVELALLDFHACPRNPAHPGEQQFDW